MFDKCPRHPEASGPSKFDGLWCKGAGGEKCAWQQRDFVNELEGGEKTVVRKWLLPEGGKWLTLEEYRGAIGEYDGSVPLPASTSPEAPNDWGVYEVRQSCIKAAAAYYTGTAADTVDRAGAEVTNLAGILEDWVNR